MTNYDHIKKPWGVEGTIVSEDLYSGRILIIYEGQENQNIYQKRRKKTVFILQGIVELILAGEKIVLPEGSRYNIQPKVAHQLKALKGDATIIEIGTKFDEDDIVSIKKDR